MSAPADEQPFGTPMEILHAFTERLAPFGPIQALRLFCRADQPQQLLCMVQMDSGATTAVANVPRAFVTGTDVCTLIDVPHHFSCENRAAGQMKVSSCSACRKHVDTPSPPSTERR